LEGKVRLRGCPTAITSLSRIVLVAADESFGPMATFDVATSRRSRGGAPRWGLLMVAASRAVVGFLLGLLVGGCTPVCPAIEPTSSGRS